MTLASPSRQMPCISSMAEHAGLAKRGCHISRQAAHDRVHTPVKVARTLLPREPSKTVTESVSPRLKRWKRSTTGA